MALDPARLASRRSLLAGALGGTAAVVAASVAGVQRVLAAGDDGATVVIAGTYDHATDTTRIVNNTNNQAAFRAGNNQGGSGLQGFSGSGWGVSGDSHTGVAVKGFSSAGKAVQADVYGSNSWGVHVMSHHVSGVTYATLSENWSPAGVAVLGNNYATTGNAEGVQGTTDSPTGYATVGWARKSGTAVVGASGPTFPGAVPVKTGVYGYASQDASSRGLYGYSTSGRGVNGVATSGTAGYFATTDPARGTSLRATGRVRLDRSAGVATIAKGAKSVTVKPGIDIVSTAAVVATLQGNAGGATTVQRVSINPTANTFTIYLTANTASATKVAWHVFG